MSVSTTATLLPARASWAATLAVVLDLPVPPRNEWIETTVVIGRGLAVSRPVGKPHTDGLWAGWGACGVPVRCGKVLP